MRGVEHSTAGRPGAADRSEIGRHRAQADADTDERDPQIRPLITPGLVSVPPMPAWLRKLFRRKDTQR
jgi:hypothetical protein